MYTVGHFALGYLFGKGVSLVVKTKINMPLLMLISIMPDIDLILQAFYGSVFTHRVETHSIITYIAITMPFLIIYREKAFPYLAALISHSLIGDLFTGGAGLLWPVTSNLYGIQTIDVTSPIVMAAETILFTISLPLMLYAKDLQSLLKPNKYTPLLIIPFFAVLGPTLQAGRMTNAESSLPFILLIPSIFWLIVFVCAGFIWTGTRLRELKSIN